MSSFLSSKGRLIVVCAIAASVSPVSAIAQQTGGVTGTVIDTISREALPGIQIVLPELHLETRTDDRGHFRIVSVPPGRHEIRAALLGCRLASEVVEVQAGESATVILRFALRPIPLRSLVVTGGAAGAIEANLPVTGDRMMVAEWEALGTRTIGDLIQGGFAGASVIRGSGLPGEDPSIQLRGPTSIQGGQDPLVVVDGVISRGRPGDIDPLDIRSIIVLKGAAAAAAYGSQGQAGVIEIRTKRGPDGLSSREEPLLILDGAITGRRLADIDPADIEDMEIVRGAAVEALFGSRAEAGVIRIATRDGSSMEEGDLCGRIYDPLW